MAVTAKKRTSSRTTKPKTAAKAESPASTSSAVGAELKAIRESKKITLKAVSSSLNIRVGQLEAIESGDIDQLPGFTYAVGFVRSYAGYLGLDPKEYSSRFKMEQRQADPEAELFFPEPVDENVIPSPVTIGVAAFLCVMLLVLWTVYSNVGSTDSMPSEGEAAVLQGQAEMDAMQMPPEEVLTNLQEDALLAEGGGKVEDPAEEAGLTSVAEVDVQPLAAKNPDFAKEDKTLAKDIADGKTEAAPVPEIKIAPKKNRVVLSAQEASWIQVTDRNQKVLFRKVLRPGDKYLVPDEPGLTLITANAGGLDIFVDDKKVQSVGESGEIVRGVSLDPKELARRRIKAGVRR